MQALSDRDQIVQQHVGARVRGAREAAGLSKAKLAAGVGVSVQQVSMYEAGRTRITPPRLYDLAHALCVPTSYFFEGLPGEAHLKQAGFTMAIGDDPGLQRLIEIYQQAETPMRRELLGFAEFLSTRQR